MAKQKGKKQKIDRYTAMPVGLDLNFLRAANVARSEDPRGFGHPLDKWSVAEWTNAMAGEAGEACNIAKKILRIDLELRGNIKKSDKVRVKLVEELMRELADVVVYADLVAARVGCNLSNAIVETWNKKSKQLGYDFLL